MLLVLACVVTGKSEYKRTGPASLDTVNRLPLPVSTFNRPKFLIRTGASVLTRPNEQLRFTLPPVLCMNVEPALLLRYTLFSPLTNNSLPPFLEILFVLSPPVILTPPVN